MNSESCLLAAYNKLVVKSNKLFINIKAEAIIINNINIMDFISISNNLIERKDVINNS